MMATTFSGLGRLAALLAATSLPLAALMAQPAAVQTPTGPSPGAAPPPAPATPPTAEDEEPEIVGPGAGGLAAGDIVVIGTRIPNVIRATPSVVSVLTQAEIARTGEGDIAGALQRVTGLSVVGGRYVYVRGLGERYSQALLNGLPLPSPEPLRRVVPLDLFPTSVIASSVVQKSFTADYPGEFGGGVINLTTRAIPTERFLEIGGSVGGNTETTGQLGYTHFGSPTDWTGFDSGRRSVPVELRAAINSGNRLIVGPNFSLPQVQRITSSLNNASTNLIQRNDNIPADFSLGINFGNSWDVGATRVGVLLSGGWRNGWDTRGGLQQVAAGVTIIDGEQGLRPDQDYRFLSTENRIVVNGLAGLGFEFGEHRLRFTNLFVRDSLKESRIQAGIDEVNVGNDDPVNRSFTGWFERQLFTSQGVGEFRFGDLAVNLRGTFANSKRRAPYERFNSYRFSREVSAPGIEGVFINDLTSNGSRSTISFSDLDDKVYAGGIDVGWRVPVARPVTLTAGYLYFDNEREAERRDFRYVTAGGAALPIAVAQTRPDYLLSDFNIATYGIVLIETSGADGAARYEASLRTHAAYAMGEAELLDGVRLNLGVRFEDGRQRVTPIALFGLPPLQTTAVDQQYWLPGGTLTWNFAEDMQLRFAASKTIARPQFRELAPQVYTDIDTDRTAFGNQFLVDSELVNAEARYEWYFARDQRITVGAFGKRITRPIETVSFESGGTFRTTFANAPKAELYGAEAEVLFLQPLDGWGLGRLFDERRLLLQANYTWTQSELRVREEDTTINAAGNVLPATALFTDGQPLTGQSEHIANLQLGFQHAGRTSEQTILLNYASPRSTQRGPSGTPDYREKPGLLLDFVAREDIAIGRVPMQLKFEVRNILGTRYEESQSLGGSRVFINRFDRGTSFSLGLTANF